MGKLEAKIKEDVMQSIFDDTTKIYEIIENRFVLEAIQREELIALCNRFNDELTSILKATKLA